MDRINIETLRTLNLEQLKEQENYYKKELDNHIKIWLFDYDEHNISLAENVKNIVDNLSSIRTFITNIRKKELYNYVCTKCGIKYVDFENEFESLYCNYQKFNSLTKCNGLIKKII